MVYKLISKKYSGLCFLFFCKVHWISFRTCCDYSLLLNMVVWQKTNTDEYDSSDVTTASESS